MISDGRGSLTASRRGRSCCSPSPDDAAAPMVAPGNPLIGVMLAYAPVQLLFDRLAAGGRSRRVGDDQRQRSPHPITYGDRMLTARSASSTASSAMTGPILVLATTPSFASRRPDSDVRPPVATRGGSRRFRCLARPGSGSIRVRGRRGAEEHVLSVAEHVRYTAPRAWISQHMGDMENIETLTAFERAVDGLMSMYKIVPDVIAIDAHPGYQSQPGPAERSTVSRAPRSVLSSTTTPMSFP